MRFARPIPFSLPTQNINSKSGEFLEFFSVLDVSKNLLPNKSESFALYVSKSPLTPDSLSSPTCPNRSPCRLLRYKFRQLSSPKMVFNRFTQPSEMSSGFLDLGSIRAIADTGNSIHVSRALKLATFSIVDQGTSVAKGSRNSTPRHLFQSWQKLDKNELASEFSITMSRL